MHFIEKGVAEKATCQAIKEGVAQMSHRLLEKPLRSTLLALVKRTA